MFKHRVTIWPSNPAFRIYLEVYPRYIHLGFIPQVYTGYIYLGLYFSLIVKMLL